MNELRPVKTYSDLSTLSLNDKTKFRLHEINKIKYYFELEIRERDAVIKKLSKYTAILDYTDRTLIVLSAASAGISNTGIIKKQLKETRKKKKKHSKTIMLAKCKLNSIEGLIPQALIDLDISHVEFKAIVNEKEKYDPMKVSIRNNKN